MTRRSVLLAAAGFVLTAATLTATAQDPNQPPPPQPPQPIPKSPDPSKNADVEIYGTNGNLDLGGGVPSIRVITTERDWKLLARQWDVRNPPDVDFKRDFLVVVTSRSGQLVVQTKVTPDGDLRVTPLENGDVQGGFRYGIKSIRRDGVKTVNGRPLETSKEPMRP